MSRVHQLEGIVDLIQWQHFGDHLIDLDLAVEVAVHVSRQLRAALDAPECKAAPDATGNQLERTSRYFLTCPCVADANRFAPSPSPTPHLPPPHINFTSPLHRKPAPPLS